MKKGQEEIVGFVVVIVLLMIVGLIYLGISIRNPEETIGSSIEAKQFLDSSLEYSIECNSVVSLGSLLESCRTEDLCGTRSSCDILNETLRGLITAGLKPGKDRPIEQILFKASYVQNTSSGSLQRSFFSITLGNCTSTNKQGAYTLYPSQQGFIRAELETCP